MQKILRINPVTETYREEELPQEWVHLGGRFLTSLFVSQEVVPNCDPLSNSNKVFIANGPFAGTNVPCAGRLSVGGKSPLTGTIKEANSGGTAGHRLASLGYRMVIIEGEKVDDLEKLKIIHIHKDGISFHPAGEYKDTKNYAFFQDMQSQYGDKSSLISTGPAGVRRYLNSTIAVTDLDYSPARHAARGGLGALLASKGVKAIAIEEGDLDHEFHDQEAFQEVVKEWTKALSKGKKVLTDYGTANLINPVNEVGGLITRNFSSGSFEHAENISGEKLREILQERNGQPSHACMNVCPIRCSNVFVDENGNHVTSALEFETLGCVGSNCGLSSLDTIAKIDRFCDDFGLDTMELGDTFAVAMESGLLDFGDDDTFINLLHSEIEQDTKLGRILSSGAAIAGKVLNVQRVPVVKNQGLSAYDPRALKGTGVTYATTPMGADHTAGNCLPGRGGYSHDTKGGADTHSKEMQTKISKEIQELSTAVDCTGMCFFVGANLVTMDYLARLINAKFGREVEISELLKNAGQVLQTEYRFNEKAGVNKPNNKLPDFFYEEKLPPNNLVFDVDREEIENFWE